jgi:hypothetical protein
MTDPKVVLLIFDLYLNDYWKASFRLKQPCKCLAPEKLPVVNK